jgi:DnaJ-class molecular chaperone
VNHPFSLLSSGAVSHSSVCPTSDTVTIPTPPLLSECDDCSGCGQITHDHPNDPWAKTWTCRECEGTGEVTLECNGWRCREDATEWVDGAAWCPVHAAEQKADAESVA